VYDEVVTPLVERVRSGYGTTVLCYGQTGTGKTYTLAGVAEALAQDLLGTDVEMDFFRGLWRQMP
jgi:kinesin family protein 2/24